MVRRIITNNNDIWKMISTDSNKVLIESNSLEGFKKSIALDIIYRAKRDAIKELMLFPQGDILNSKFVPINSDSYKEYSNWLSKVFKECNSAEELYNAIDLKLNELLKDDSI